MTKHTLREENAEAPKGLMKVDNLIEILTQSAELSRVYTGHRWIWRSGAVTTPDGDQILMGGGWVEDAESAGQKNEELGIAGGLRQGVQYPNEVCPGDYSPYARGEDCSGWEDEILPLVLGDQWQEHEDYIEVANRIYNAVQEAMTRIANKRD